MLNMHDFYLGHKVQLFMRQDFKYRTPIFSPEIAKCPLPCAYTVHTAIATLDILSSAPTAKPWFTHLMIACLQELVYVLLVPLMAFSRAIELLRDRSAHRIN